MILVRTQIQMFSIVVLLAVFSQQPIAVRDTARQQHNLFVLSKMCLPETTSNEVKSLGGFSLVLRLASCSSMNLR